MKATGVTNENAFDGITIEDINSCPSQNFGSGIKTRLCYAPASFFKLIKLPNENLSYEESLAIWDSDIVFQDENTWSYLDILVDENELKTLIDGNNLRKKEKSELQFFLLGFNQKNIGFIKKCKNEPMIFGIEDSEGKFWLLGNLRNRAFLASADGTTGKQYDENSGFLATVTTNSPLIAVIPVKSILINDDTDMDLPIEYKLQTLSLDLFWHKNQFKTISDHDLGKKEAPEDLDSGEFGGEGELAGKTEPIGDGNQNPTQAKPVKIKKLFVNIPDWEILKNYNLEIIFERYGHARKRGKKDDNTISFRPSGFRNSLEQSKPSVFPVTGKKTSVDFFPEKYFKKDKSGNARTTGTYQSRYGSGSSIAWQYFQVRLKIKVGNQVVISPPLQRFKVLYSVYGNNGGTISYKYV